jgi:hypothetical protein
MTIGASTIHAVYVHLAAELKAKGVPFEIAYGPTQVPPKVGASRIVVQHDHEAGDQNLGPRSQMKNPRQYAVRAMGGLVRIHAMATVESATRGDHERIANILADLVTVALIRIARRAKTEQRIVREGFAVDATTDGWAGALYEIRFQFDRGVHDVTYQGAAMPEGEVAHTSTSMTTSGPAAAALPTATTRIL